jgi:hypothetical protein
MRSADWGTTWEPEVRLADNPGTCMFPVLAASGRNVHIAWYDNRTGNNQLYYRNSTNGGLDWTPELGLTQTSTNSSNPAIALSGDAVHVVFCDDRSGDSELYYLRNPTGNAGVEESLKPQAPSRKPVATIIHGVLRLADGPSTTSSPSWLLDISGRKVQGLQPGANDLSRLVPGVYFVRERLAVNGERSAVGVRKVVVTK